MEAVAEWVVEGVELLKDAAALAVEAAPAEPERGSNFEPHAHVKFRQCQLWLARASLLAHHWMVSVDVDRYHPVVKSCFVSQDATLYEKLDALVETLAWDGIFAQGSERTLTGATLSWGDRCSKFPVEAELFQESLVRPVYRLLCGHIEDAASHAASQEVHTGPHSKHDRWSRHFPLLLV